MDGVVFCRVTGCLTVLVTNCNTFPVGASLLVKAICQSTLCEGADAFASKPAPMG
jgi:hypothetical protein